MNELYGAVETNSIDTLVISGGVSNNYRTTLDFIETIGKDLSRVGKRLRFIVGNTDLYYPTEESVIDKKAKFNEIIKMYRDSEYYLPNNPIITGNLRIMGSETWYDYSLYRGRPRNLKDITKKRVLWIRNRDNDYITDEADYCLGIKNTFDYKYSKECAKTMVDKLNSVNKGHGYCKNSIMVTYFKSSHMLLNDGLLDKYLGTFDGSSDYHEIMRDRKVTQCIYGKGPVIDKTIEGVSYIGSCGKRVIIDYS